MMAVIKVVCKRFGQTASANKTEFMRLWSTPGCREIAKRMEAFYQRCDQTIKFAYLGCVIGADSNFSTEANVDPAPHEHPSESILPGQTIAPLSEHSLVDFSAMLSVEMVEATSH